MTVPSLLVALVSHANVARMATTIYTAALLATLPVVVAGLAAFLLRDSSAEARGLVWRSAAAGLLFVFVGRQLSLHWIAWVVPSAIAAPLVALGRVQMVASTAPTGAAASASGIVGDAATSIAVVRTLFALYIAGVIAVLLPTLAGMVRARRRIDRSTSLADVSWISVLEQVRAALGITRRVRLFVDERAVVPMTWGVFAPVVVLPPSAHAWNDTERRIVILHELAHVRSGDWAFNLLGRMACALYWFHPGAWWIARNMRDDCELACDDRVIASGIRRSDYAELLVTAASALEPSTVPTGVALALSQRGGLRARLAAVLDVRHTVRPLRRGWAVAAVMVTATTVCPTSAVQLAPTRDVLTTLMRDTRWESRAYAVLGLAQRADSIAEARSAAEADPSPRVRAWARYALGEQRDRPDVQTIIREH